MNNVITKLTLTLGFVASSVVAVAAPADISASARRGDAGIAVGSFGRDPGAHDRWDGPDRDERGRDDRRSRPGRPGEDERGYLRNVYRFFNGKDHFLTVDENEGYRAGYRGEGIAFQTFARRERGLVPLFRCYTPQSGDHFASQDFGCEGNTQEGILGYVAAESDRWAPREVVRCYNGRDHLITTNPRECQMNRYRIEGVLGYVP